jgi:hypothetical protein
MERILQSVGLASAKAEQFDVRGESVLVVSIDGDGEQIWRRARAALSDRYPVLVLDDFDNALDSMYFEQAPGSPVSPSEVLARAADVDVDARIAELSRQRLGPDLGTGDEDYGSLDGYDVRHFGNPKYLVIVPRPEPWAAFAYVASVFIVGGHEPELFVAAAHRWYERYGAEPTVSEIATGFMVSNPPTDIADAERLAAEHLFFGGLTARGVPLRAYARALLRLDRWTLYNRP